MRCRSWRISDQPHRPIHRPGSCDICWGPCHNHVDKIEHIGHRCTSCWTTLANEGKNDSILALSILKETDVPDFVLDILEGSDLFVVAQSAQDRKVSVGAQ